MINVIILPLPVVAWVGRVTITQRAWLRLSPGGPLRCVRFVRSGKVLQITPPRQPADSPWNDMDCGCVLALNWTMNVVIDTDTRRLPRCVHMPCDSPDAPRQPCWLSRLHRARSEAASAHPSASTTTGTWRRSSNQFRPISAMRCLSRHAPMHCLKTGWLRQQPTTVAAATTELRRTLRRAPAMACWRR